MDDVRLTRRRFLQALGALALAPACLPARTAVRSGADVGSGGVELNDVHSQLNASRVARVVPVASLADVQAAIRAAQAEGRAVSIAGGRHAMGGQQFGADTLHLDTRQLRRVLAFDAERGIVEAEAGIQWPELIEWYLDRQGEAAGTWGIVQKQTGADRLALGGAVGANAHGRGLTLKPFVGDLEFLTVVDTEGRLVRCDRNERPDLFRLVVGGYGLFGVVYSVGLRLRRRQKVERLVEVRGMEGVVAAFAERARDGCLYGDFQFETDERSSTFLRRGVFACYRPVPDDTPIPAAQAELSGEQWMEVLSNVVDR